METLQRTANRGSISTGFDIDYSLKNESDNGERFQSTSLGTPTSVRTFTFSMWVKRTEIGGSQQYILNHQANTGITVGLKFAADSSTESLYYIFENSSVQAYGKTKAVFRDTSAWMHIVWRVDTTQSTATDRVRIYVNGVEEEIESGGGGHPAHPDQNYDVPLQTTQYLLGYDGGNNGFCGYAAEYLYSDGQSLAPTEFGEYDDDTGIWIPKDVSGTTFGDAGYYLDFADSSALGKDVGNSKGDFSHYGGGAADQATDTPTNSFATMNPLVPTADVTVSEGGTKVAASGGVSSWDTSFSSVGVTSGKWYFECRGTATDGTHFYGCVDESDIALVLDDYIGSSAGGPNAIGYYGNTGNIQINGTTVVSASSWPHNTTMALALDLDNGKAYFGRHNVWQNSADPAAGSNGISLPTAGTGTWFFAINASYFDGGSMNTNHGGYTAQTPDSAAADANGYGTFEFAPPSGFYALCTKNLAEYG